MSGIERNDNKLRELIVYVAAHTADDPHMGAMKLNKVLFHAEVRAYLRLGNPISGHPYMKRELGPAPKGLLPIRNSLESERAIEVVHSDVGAPNRQDRVVAKRAADVSLFREGELGIVDEVIRELRPFTGTAVSDVSHQLPGWRAVGMNTLIPYETAFVSVDVTKAEHRRARELGAALSGSG